VRWHGASARQAFAPGRRGTLVCSGVRLGLALASAALGELARLPDAGQPAAARQPRLVHFRAGDAKGAISTSSMPMPSATTPRLPLIGVSAVGGGKRGEARRVWAAALAARPIPDH